MEGGCFMANKVVGYSEVVKNPENWAKDVSVVGDELMKLGFNIRTGPLSVYTLKREETFFDVRYKEDRVRDSRFKALTLMDTSSWVRVSSIQNITKGETEPKYFIDYRMGIDGDVKKFACFKKPDVPEIESVTRFFSSLSDSGFMQARLFPVIELDVESYHIVMVKPSESVAGVNAVIEMIYKIQRDKQRPDAGAIVSFELKDRTAKRGGAEAGEIMSGAVADANLVMRRYAKRTGKSMLCGNPYMEIHSDVERLRNLEDAELLDINAGQDD